MFSFLKRLRREHILEKYRIPDSVWARTLGAMQSIDWMSEADQSRLRELTSMFLHEKSIEPAQGVELTEAMRVRIAAEAAVPILNLGLEYYRDFYSVIVYEEAFMARDNYEDEAGVLHSDPEERAGEAWHHGPVIVSWADIAGSVAGYNVVIHEMAHKLDMLDGDANGKPPLHSGMSPVEWASVFTAVYEHHLAEVDKGMDTIIDDYAATSPGEFFAVCSEVFFEAPTVLKQQWPEVYRQMALYYRVKTGE